MGVRFRRDILHVPYPRDNSIHILPTDVFGAIEVILYQPGNSTKLARIGAVAYVPRLLRNLLFNLKSVEL